MITFVNLYRIYEGEKIHGRTSTCWWIQINTINETLHVDNLIYTSTPRQALQSNANLAGEEQRGGGGRSCRCVDVTLLSIGVSHV